MNWLDIVILVPCVWGLIKGISNGIVKEVMQIVSLILGIWLSIKFSDKVLAFVLSKFPQFNDSISSYAPGVVKIVAFILMMLLIVLVVRLLSGIIEKIINMVDLGWLNRIIGAVFGFLKGVLIVSILFFFLNNSLKIFNLLVKEETQSNSILLPYINKVSEKFAEYSTLSSKDTPASSDEEDENQV